MPKGNNNKTSSLHFSIKFTKLTYTKTKINPWKIKKTNRNSRILLQLILYAYKAILNKEFFF